MREWLTVIIVLLIAGILLDGLRRVRKARRETLRLSRNARKFDKENFPEATSELGEPRVVRQRDSQDAESLTRSMRESFVKSRKTVGAPQRIPEQVALNLQESVPMLMESVEEEGEESYSDAGQPDYTRPPAWDDAGPLQGPREKPVPRRRAVEEPNLGSLDDLDEQVEHEPEAEFETPEVNDSQQSYAVENQSSQEPLETAEQEEQEALREPEEVLIMNLMAPAGQRFAGDELLQALLDEGLRFGAMDIFHKHKHANGSGPVQFSLANMVVPGTFNLATMDEFSTPGVSMFLSLPSEDESIVAFDSLARTARALAQRLGGELKDENRSVMTRQTIEHCRQRVLEYERKRRLHQ